MKLEDIHAFLIIYESKSINSAAQELFISPQGLSKLVKRLENELGTVLFLRNSRGLYPTMDADAFYIEIRPLAKRLEKIIKSFKNKQANEVLRVIHTLGYFQFLSLDLISSFKNSYPNINLIIEERTDYDVQKRILDKQFDLGIMAGPIEHPQLSSSFLCSLEHVLILNDDDPLAQKNYLSFRDLDGRRLALLSHQCNARTDFMNRLEQAGAIPDEIFESDLLDILHLRASQNGCVGQSIRPFADNYMNLYKNTVLRPFEDRTFLWTTYFVWRKDCPLSEVANEFISRIHDWLKLNSDKIVR